MPEPSAGLVLVERDHVGVAVGRERRVERLAAPVVVLLARVGVAIEGHDGAAVAEPLLHFLEGERAGLAETVHKQTRVRVP